MYLQVFVCPQGRGGFPTGGLHGGGVCLQGRLPSGGLPTGAGVVCLGWGSESRGPVWGIEEVPPELEKRVVCILLECFFVLKKIVEPLITLFWTSGDLCPEFQSQDGSLASVLHRLNAIDSSDSDLPQCVTECDKTLFQNRWPYKRSCTAHDCIRLYEIFVTFFVSNDLHVKRPFEY